MRKMMLMLLTLAAVIGATGSAPRVEAQTCDWFCDGQTPRCSCPNPRSCPWPPPPMQCPF